MAPQARCRRGRTVARFQVSATQAASTARQEKAALMIPKAPGSAAELRALKERRIANVIVPVADAGENAKVIWPVDTFVWEVCERAGDHWIFTVSHLVLDVAASVYPPQMTLETFLGKVRTYEARDSDALAAQLRDKPPEPPKE